MALDKTNLAEEWALLPKNWYSVYQWTRTSRPGYTEWIAEWIKTSIAGIRLEADGLRQRSFRVPAHRGQIKLQTDIKQLTEKRLLRAMFNLSKVPVMGKVVDYEIPLKETEDADHGDIDLLCSCSDSALCVEAKKPRASESVLKAILQAFVYTSLIATRREAFLKDFDLSPSLKLTPAVLTFASAQSGRQIRERKTHPHLLRLTSALNAKLAEKSISPLRFFLVENPDAELETCLRTTLEPNKDVKVVFCDGFTLKVSEYLFSE